MSNRNDEETIAKNWLWAQGYKPERPTWLPIGKNPDYWATNAALMPSHFWAEVKSIEPDDSTTALSKFRNLIKTAKIPPNMTGHGMVHIEPRAIEPSIRWVLKAFGQSAPKFCGHRAILVFIQQTRDADGITYARIDARVPIFLQVRHTGSRKMHLPIAMPEVPFANAKVVLRDGNEKEGKAFEFFEWSRETECSLVAHINPSARPFKDFGVSSGGPGQATNRTVRAIEEANRQIKKACATRDAAGIVLLVPRDPFYDNTSIASAVYGELTVPFAVKDTSVVAGEIFHGLNGVFRPNKCRHISAAVHIHRGEGATYFPNPYAFHAIQDDAPIFLNSTRTDVSFI